MSKPLQILLSVLLVVLIAGSIYFFFFAKNGEEDKDSIDKAIKNSVEVSEVTTNLQGDDFIRISFTIETNSSDAKKELEKRDFQVNNIIIKHLSGLKAEDLEGTEGKIRLEEALKEKINAIMQNGEIEQVYITSCIIQ